MKDRKMPFLGIGAASIVLVLAMVCLAVFAALTLSSAKGDHTLSKKNLERTSAFYQASNAANEQVGAIDEKLWKLYRRSKDKKDYMKRVGRSFTKSKGISYNKKEKTIEKYKVVLIEKGNELLTYQYLISTDDSFEFEKQLFENIINNTF